jgi:heat shock protein HspQ
MKNTFNTGDLIHHRRYGYRGVVVEWDPVCKADDEWYQRNKTQPVRDQPWYHVLVDGSDQTTYVAQENLEPDTSNSPVSHPLLGRFFASFYKGRYYHQGLN